MGHDEEDDGGAAGLFLLVLEGDQAECRDGHDFPRQQEEERVRGGEDQRQAEQQQVIEEAHGAQVARLLHGAQIAE